MIRGSPTWCAASGSRNRAWIPETLFHYRIVEKWVTALLMILALFFSPLVQMVGSGYKISDQVTLYPVIAPALIIVGAFMFKSITRIDWDDYTESIPAFLTIIMMPLSFSITEGISMGLISYVLLKLVTGKGKTVHWLIYTFALLFIARYIFISN